MVGRSKVVGAAAVLSMCLSMGQARTDLVGKQASEDVRYAASWVLDRGDNQRQPFAIVDKKDARIYVFEAKGRLIGASAVLLGLAPGDLAAPGTVGRAPSSLRPDERTTPAGRFASEPGRNDKGEGIVWIDYDTALAIHRLRPKPSFERRSARLASPAAHERRISFGCVVVPVEFYENVVAPSLGRRRGVVYVLPETRPVHAMFGAFEVGQGAP